MHNSSQGCCGGSHRNSCQDLHGRSGYAGKSENGIIIVIIVVVVIIIVIIIVVVIIIVIMNMNMNMIIIIVIRYAGKSDNGIMLNGQKGTGNGTRHSKGGMHQPGRSTQ